MSETGYMIAKMPEPQNGEEVKECLRHSREVLRKTFGDLLGRTTFDFALEYIEKLEAAQPKWISVEERLPEDGAFAIFYYVKNEKNMMAVGCYFDYGMFIVDGHSVNVTHWMPLPEPPKEEE